MRLLETQCCSQSTFWIATAENDQLASSIPQRTRLPKDSYDILYTNCIYISRPYYLSSPTVDYTHCHHPFLTISPLQVQHMPSRAWNRRLVDANHLFVCSWADTLTVVVASFIYSISAFLRSSGLQPAPSGTYLPHLHQPSGTQWVHRIRQRQRVPKVLLVIMCPPYHFSKVSFRASEAISARPIKYASILRKTYNSINRWQRVKDSLWSSNLPYRLSAGPSEREAQSIAELSRLVLR